MKFLLFLPLSGHRRRADPTLLHAAKIVATQYEDCGPCVQIAVNAALDDRVEAQVIRAILHRDTAEMPGSLPLVVRFAEAVLSRDGSEVAAGEQIEKQLGSSVLTELSLAVATARVFPTLKRGLGFAATCSLMDLDLEGKS